MSDSSQTTESSEPAIAQLIELSAEQQYEEAGAVVTPISDPQINDVAAKEAARIEWEQLEYRKAQDKAKRDDDKHKLRNWTLIAFAVILAYWLIFLSYVVCYHLKFGKLSDPVMIAFLTTTTATVLGLVAIAARWLFGQSDD